MVNGLDINDDSFMTEYDRRDYRQAKNTSRTIGVVGTALAAAHGAGMGALATGGNPLGVLAGAAIEGGGLGSALAYSRRQELAAKMNNYRSDYFDNSKVRKRRRTVYDCGAVRY